MISNNLSEPFNYANDKIFSTNDFYSFWSKVSLKIHWDKIYTKLWSGNEKKPEWFKDGLINACNNILDINLKQTSNNIAFIHECPLIGKISKITYKELFERVCIFSMILKNQNIKKGDIVMIIMPSFFETFIAMLSCCRIGAIYSHVSIFFDEIKICERVEYLNPKLILSVNYFVGNDGVESLIPKLKKALSNYNGNNILILDRIDFIGKDRHINYLNENKYNNNDLKIESSLDWYELTQQFKNKSPFVEYEILNSTDPYSISFSSGTTGEPKGFIHETGGFLCNIYYSYKNNYSFKNGDIILSTCSMAWNYGSNLIMGSLFNCCTTIVYEGSVLNSNYDFFKIIEKYKVNKMVTSPLVFNSIYKNDPIGNEIKKYNLSSLEYIGLGGERLSNLLSNYLYKQIGINIKIFYGQTETSMILSNWTSLNGPLYREYSSGVPVVGLNICLNSIQNKTPLNEPFRLGELVIKLPFSPLQVQELYKDCDQSKMTNEYLKEYPGYYNTGDLGYFDNENYFYIVGRVKESINLGNNNIVYNSFFEDSIQLNNKVYENVVVPVLSNSLTNITNKIKQVPAAFIVLKDQFKIEYTHNPIQFINQLKNEINQSLVFNSIINNTYIEYLVIVDELPKSVSFKKLRIVLSYIFNDIPYEIPSIILNAKVLTDIENTIKYYKSLSILN